MKIGSASLSLETPRTSLQPISVRDANLVYTTLNDPRVARYLDHPPPPSLEEARVMIRAMVAPEAARWWAICSPAGRGLGFAGLNGFATPSVGIVLDPSAWGHGLAKEILGAVVGFGFEAMGLSHVEAHVHEDNAAARALIEHLGFTARGALHRFYPAEGRVRLTTVLGRYADRFGSGAEPWADPPKEAEVCKQLVLLPVQDIQATLEFYVGMLGFRLDFVRGDPPQYVAVSLGRWSSERGRIHFFAAPCDGPGSGLRPTLYFCPGEGLVPIYQRVKASSAHMIRDLVEIEAGIKEFVLVDPGGYKIVFRNVL